MFNKFSKIIISTLTFVFILTILIFKNNQISTSHYSVLIKAFLTIAFIIAFIITLKNIFNFKWYKPLIFLIVIEIFLTYAYKIPLFFYQKIETLSPSFINNGIKTIHQKIIENSALINTNNKSFLNFSFGKYDSTLFYKHNSGNTFDYNLEFKNNFSFNSKGFRGKENDLDNPKIIFLGDSYTCGIGVNQNENFPYLISKKLGIKCLNTGTSSYGTARELILLKQLNIDSTKLLVLQYCENDVEENLKYNQDSLHFISSKAVFDQSVNTNKLRQYYYPFKNFVGIISRKIENSLFASSITNASKENSDTIFIDLLNKIGQVFKGPIIVLTLSYEPNSTKINDFRTLGKQLANVHFVDVNHNLHKFPEDYYLFDSHINKNGHQKVANTLTEYIKRNNLLK